MVTSYSTIAADVEAEQPLVNNAPKRNAKLLVGSAAAADGDPAIRRYQVHQGRGVPGKRRCGAAPAVEPHRRVDAGAAADAWNCDV